LKSLKISEAKKQLINGEIFVSYLSNLLKAYKNTSLDDFEKRFFIFTTDLKKKNSTDNKNKIKPLARDGKKLFISACNKRHYIDRFDLS
jgi:hypothetical protein